jgi:very-short-patch-repair endonuclease
MTCPQRSTPKSKHLAVKLRKDLTPMERKPWSRIRNDQLGVNFHRVFDMGKPTPDFTWRRPPERGYYGLCSATGNRVPCSRS